MLAGFPAERPVTPLVFGEIGGRRCRLRMNIGALGELETASGRGVFEINMRFAQQHSSATEIIEIMRLGLIGGGDCTPAEVEAVIDVFVRPRVFEFFALAQRVFLALVAGVDPVDGDPEGEAMGRRESPETSGPSIASDAASA